MEWTVNAYTLVFVFVGAGLITLGGFLALLLPGRQALVSVTVPILAESSAIPVA